MIFFGAIILYIIITHGGKILKIHFELDSELLLKIDMLSERVFMGNRRKTIEHILEVAFQNDMVIKGRRISEIMNFEKINFSVLDGNFTSQFKKNFGKLEIELQQKLFKFFKLLQETQNCRFGTQSNISVYSPEGYIMFYVNITGRRGTEYVKDYIERVKLTGAFLSEARNLSSPLTSVYFARKDQFVRNVKYEPLLSPLLFDKLYTSLPFYRQGYCDVFEVNVEGIEILCDILTTKK